MSLLLADMQIPLSEALGNMLVGFGVVFIALLFLCGVISLFKYVGKLDKSGKKAPAKAPVKAASAAPAAKPAAADPNAVSGEVVAVILAAVAEKCGPNARVTSIEKCR